MSCENNKTNSDNNINTNNENNYECKNGNINNNDANDESIGGNDNNNNNTCNDGSNSSNNSNEYYCGDIPGGFQTINPEIFNIIGEVLADVVSGRMPFNIQNSIGNWIQLVGQAIETYSAQQTYFQSGPGRMYNIKYYNVTNPFCPNDGQNTSSSGESSSGNYEDSSISQGELILIIEQLKKEVDNINIRLDKIEKV